MYFPILLDIKNKLSKIEYSNGVLPNNKLGILANSFYVASELKQSNKSLLQIDVWNKNRSGHDLYV